MKEICIVTHTQATHHQDNIVGGWYDSELTDKGISDAVKCGNRLKQYKLEGVEIFSSDLKRSLQTAERISDILGSVIHTDSRLREMSFGDANGRKHSWMNKRMISYDGKNRLDHAVIRGGETRRELAIRLYSAMDDVVSGRDKAVICTHSYAATFLIACWIGMPIGSAGYVRFNIRPGSITRLEQDDFFMNRSVVSLNETGHLIV